MKPSRLKDDGACFLCDWWWLLLLILLLIVAAVATRSLWQPLLFPTSQTLGTGDVQVTLRWKGYNDLDLHVIDPAGNELYYHNPTSSTNGMLDVDSNADCTSYRSQSPVENIYWPVGKAPTGTYRVAVVYFKVCQPEAPSDFTVRVLVDGKAQTFNGRVTAAKESVMVYEFQR